MKNVQRWGNKHSWWTAKWSAICSDGHAQSADQKICERQCFTISELLWEFPQLGHTFISFQWAGFQICSRVHPNAENGFGTAFLKQYHKDGDQFLSHIVWVTRDKTWVSIVNSETKEQVGQWMHTYSPNKQKKFIWQEADSNCLLGQEIKAEGGIHATRGHNVTSVWVLWNIRILHTAKQNKTNGMLTYSEALLRDTAHPPTLKHSCSSERLPSVYSYLPGEPAEITALHQ